MTHATFDTGEIANHAALTRQRADDLQQAILNLRSAASQLAAVWTGPGASAFQTARDDWERAVLPLQESLVSLSATLSQTSSAYDSNESSIARAFGG